MLVTATSGLPSLFRSPAAIEKVKAPFVGYGVAGPKPPLPLPSRTETELGKPLFTTARSALPSRLKSAAETANGNGPPLCRVVGVEKPTAVGDADAIEDKVSNATK